MKRVVLSVLALAFAGFAAGARAQSLGASTPEGLRAELVRMLPMIGVQPLPMGIDVQGLTAGRINLIRADHAVVGQIEYLDDAVRGTSSFTVFDAQNQVLATSKSRFYSCGNAGHCIDVTFSTLIDADDQDTHPPFAIAINRYGTTHLRHGEIVEPIDWFRELGQSLGWLQNVLATTTHTAPALFTDPRWATYVVLALDPDIGPYLGGLDLHYVGGHLVLSGTVPSTPAYSLLALHSVEYGYRLDVVIMTPDPYAAGGMYLFPPVGLSFGDFGY